MKVAGCGGGDLQVDEAALAVGGEVREPERRGVGGDIEQDGGQDAVAEIGGEVLMVDLRTVGDLTAGLDEEVYRFGEEGAVLDQVVAKHVEGGGLIVECGFLVQGAIAEVKDEAEDEAFALDALDEVSTAEQGAGGGTDDEEAVHAAGAIVAGGKVAGVGGEGEKGGEGKEGSDSVREHVHGSPVGRSS